MRQHIVKMPKRAGDSLMRGKRYGQLMIFSDIAATMQPPPFAVFCIDADVLTGWKDVDAMITTMEGQALFPLNAKAAMPFVLTLLQQ